MATRRTEEAKAVAYACGLRLSDEPYTTKMPQRAEAIVNIPTVATCALRLAFYVNVVLVAELRTIGHVALLVKALKGILVVRDVAIVFLNVWRFDVEAWVEDTARD
jgi:hypothetical protein